MKAYPGKSTIWDMAINGPKGRGRKGKVSGRDQVLNTRTKVWTKRGVDKKFMDGKAGNAPFKGVRKHLRKAK